MAHGRLLPAVLAALLLAGAARAQAPAAVPDSVWAAWSHELQALADSGLFDPALAARFVEATFDGRRDAAYAQAAEAYLTLLEALDLGLPPEAVRALDAQLGALRNVLPEQLAHALGLGPGPGAALAPGFGARLAAWWRSQDPLPATPRNERVEEHLQRVAHARAHFSPSGRLDDRGVLYIRLGAPSLRNAIDFDDAGFRRKVLDRSTRITTADFPKAELWVYQNVDEWAQYLLVGRGERFQMGDVDDLLPPGMANVGPDERGSGKARALVRTLAEIYRQLALYHPSYAASYTEYASWVSHIDDTETVEEAAFEQATAGNAQQARQVAQSAEVEGGFYSIERLHLHAQRLMTRARAEEQQAAALRETYVPRAHSNVLEGVPALPVAVRHARFLDPDGSTRTEVYWSVAPRAEDAVILATVVQETADHRRRAVHYTRHLLHGAAQDARGVSAPQTYTVRGDTGVFHLAFEWAVYTPWPAGGPSPEAGPRLGVATRRADSLAALRPDAGALEMSDLKPVLLPEAAGVEAVLAGEATPYPYDVLTPGQPVALYFEVYHLTFGADDRTRYTVAYEVARGPERRLLPGRAASGTTAARITYAGDGTTAREAIVLDLEAWDGEGELTITVRVTDENTGRQVERDLRFRTAP